MMFLVGPYAFFDPITLTCTALIRGPFFLQRDSAQGGTGSYDNATYTNMR